MPKVSGYRSSVLYKIGAKEILEELSKSREARFKDLADLSVIRTTATLAHRLRELERTNYIEKSIHNEVGKPVHIYYRITERGKQALNLHRQLENL